MKQPPLTTSEVDMKFIVYEGIFFDRFIFREIIGETNEFWKTRNTHNLDESKVKKSSIGPHILCENEQKASKIANQITDKMLKARKHYEERKQQIIDGFKS